MGMAPVEEKAILFIDSKSIKKLVPSTPINIEV